ncbi:hypothetical protein AMTR_s00006p00256380 [Amborella trichopoda]|uniref:Uncharacterized protein n=1 Tax=Amborella trichopoda TaxID=13333 RepID=W1PCW8_AMBTC|nr:hypothetical protein AMTR_s00006p00256380 [Amborella trichopoda]
MTTHFSDVVQKLQVYTTKDYTDIIEFLVNRCIFLGRCRRPKILCVAWLQGWKRDSKVGQSKSQQFLSAGFSTGKLCRWATKENGSIHVHVMCDTDGAVHCPFSIEDGEDELIGSGDGHSPISITSSQNTRWTPFFFVL